MSDDSLGLSRGIVRVVDHDPEWARAFEAEATRIAERIADAKLPPLRFEHIGSTSVPGLAAKPILDMMAGYDRGADPQLYFDAVRAAGYEYRGPQGLPERELFVRGSDARRTHHFNLIPLGGEFWRQHLLFRDRLRSEPKTRDAYAALKRDLANTHIHDRGAYTAGKADFIRGIIEASDPTIAPRFESLVALLGGHELGWAVAGGWAIDLFLGRVTRQHADVDVAIWRDQQRLLRDALSDWELRVAEDSRLRPWREGEVLELPLHEIHADSPTGEHLEFLLNDRDEGEWIFRRDTAIRLSLSDAVRREGDVPYLAPEVILLYKSKSPRRTDEADFDSLAAHLPDASRAWLRSALVRIDPAHPWIARLDRATRAIAT